MSCQPVIPEQDCIRTRILAPYTFTLRYRSPIQEAKRKATSEEGWEQQLVKEKKMRYFNLKITASQAVWAQQSLDFAYGFQKAIHLEEGSIKRPCVLYHYEPFSGGDLSQVFVLGFENPDEKNDTGTVVIDATALQVGIVKLHPHCQ